MKLPKDGHIDAFVMIVDINSFVGMVQLATTASDSIAQFTRDVLAGAIHSIEATGGEATGFMGDAILGIIPDGKAAISACYLIAKDVDELCEYISGIQKESPGSWAYAMGGPSVKIAVEYGRLDISTISSRLLGEHHFPMDDVWIEGPRLKKITHWG